MYIVVVVGIGIVVAAMILVVVRRSAIGDWRALYSGEGVVESETIVRRWTSTNPGIDRPGNHGFHLPMERSTLPPNYYF